MDIEKYYIEHRSELIGIANGILRDYQEAEDVVQEVFLDVFKGDFLIRNEIAFFKKSVRNRARDIIRERKNKGEYPERRQDLSFVTNLDSVADNDDKDIPTGRYSGHRIAGDWEGTFDHGASGGLYTPDDDLYGTILNQCTADKIKCGMRPPLEFPHEKRKRLGLPTPPCGYGRFT